MKKCVREEQEMCERGRKWGVCVDEGDEGDEEVCDGECGGVEMERREGGEVGG